MIKRKRSINSIIHDQLLGYASEEDEKNSCSHGLIVLKKIERTMIV